MFGKLILILAIVYFVGRLLFKLLFRGVLYTVQKNTEDTRRKENYGKWQSKKGSTPKGNAGEYIPYEEVK